jgi:hypothetical protein
LISLIILLKDVPNYFFGFIIPAIVLINPAYSFFFILALIIFYSYKIVTSKKDILLIIREISKITLISLIFLSIYGFSVILIYEGNLISIFNSFLQQLKIESISISLTPIEFEGINLFNLLLGAFYLITFLLLPIVGIFLKTGTRNDNSKKDFYLFIKLGVVLTFIIVFILPHFIKTGFFVTYYTRILEAFLPCIILLSGISLKRLKLISDDLWQKIKISNIKIRNWNKNHDSFSKILNLPSLMIFSIILLSILNHIYVRENLNPNYRYDDTLMTCIFYIEDNIGASSNIGVNAFHETHSPIGLLFNYNLFNFSGDFNLTISEFTNFTQTNGLEYFVIKLSNYNEAFISDFYNLTLYDKLVGGTNNLEHFLYRIL